VTAVFSSSVTHDQLEEFLGSTVHEPLKTPSGGTYLRPGIASVIKRGVDGNEAYEICLRSDASAKKKSELQQRIRSFNFVIRVIDESQKMDFTADQARKK